MKMRFGDWLFEHDEPLPGYFLEIVTNGKPHSRGGRRYGKLVKQWAVDCKPFEWEFIIENAECCESIEGLYCDLSDYMLGCIYKCFVDKVKT